MQERAARIEWLLERIKSESDSKTRESALELIRMLMELHYEGIDRMMEIVVETADASDDILTGFAEDACVAHMLLVHGLHPIDLETRVATALESVRPYLHSHGGNVELIQIQNGAVRLRMVGSCNGCPSSSVTLKTAIEKAIHDAAPDVISIETF